MKKTDKNNYLNQFIFELIKYLHFDFSYFIKK